MLPLIIVLSAAVALSGAYCIYVQVQFVEISVLLWVLSLVFSIGILFITFYFPVRLALKTKRKRYLLFVVITILVFLAQIIFRDYIFCFWQEVIGTPMLPPRTDELL